MRGNKTNSSNNNDTKQKKKLHMSRLHCSVLKKSAMLSSNRKNSYGQIITERFIELLIILPDAEANMKVLKYHHLIRP